MRFSPTLRKPAAVLLTAFCFTPPGATMAAGEKAGAAKREQLDAAGRPVHGPGGGRRVYDDSAVLEAAAPAAAAPAMLESLPAALTASAAAAAAASAPLRLEWHRAIFGVGIGATGLHAADIDGDGTPEIVAGAGPFGFSANKYWYVVSRQGAGYEQVWASLPYASEITSLRIAQVDADSALEVLVATANTILIYDGATRELEKTLTAPASGIVGLNVVDVDADGALELVFCNASNLYVLDLATGAVEFLGTGRGGKDVAVGPVDADPALEIVVGNGTSTGFVIDGQSHAIEWSNATGFGNLTRLADLDGDGLAEIVAGFAWNDLSIYDGDTRTLKYTVPILNLGALRLADVEADGTIEILYGDAQWGDIHVLAGATGAEKWSIENPEHGVTDIAVADVDGDSVAELLWGAGHTSSGPDYLYVADSVTRATEWQNLDIGGPFYGLDHGDVDGDGAPELLYASYESESGYGDGLFFVHDAATKALEYQSGPTTGLNWTGLWRIRSANVDADPQRELFVATSSTYSGIIICYDGLSHAEQWRATVPSGMTFRSLQLADVDADGQLEVVAGVHVEHTGAPGVFVYVFDAATGALEWQSPSLGTGFRSLSLMRVANLDADPQPEIVVANYRGELFVLDAVTRSVDLTTADLGITALDTPDRNADGRSEILIGTETGAIRVIDAASGAILETVGSYGGQIDGLAFSDVTGDGLADYVFAVGDRLRVASGATGSLEWSSEVLGSGVGANDSLLVAEIDGDANLEVLVNVGVAGLMVFEAPAPDTTPPTVAITWPTEGGLVAGVVPISVSATDDVAVTQVEIYVDGVLRGTDATAPYTLDWDTGPETFGPHTLFARAYDAAGNAGTSATVSVTVVDAIPPTTAVTAPANGAVVGGNVPISCSASDNVAVTRVEFYVDGFLRLVDTVAPYTFVWHTNGWPFGPQNLIACWAYDAAGNRGVSASVWVTIDNTPPTTSITAPSPGATVSGSVTVNASASDNIGVTRVELYVDDVWRGTDYAAPYSFSWNTTGYANGSHTLKTRAFDGVVGNVGTSGLVTVTVNNPAPAVTAVFDAGLRVPKCGPLGSSCDSGALLNGRSLLGPEPNQPNTIGGSCADGTAGLYHSDESNDRIRISTLDGGAFAPGKTVRIDATVWAWAGYSQDRLDLYRAPNASGPVWTLVATLTPTRPGAQVLSATFVLPAGGLQAVRARFRYLGSASACGPGSYNDHDDLAFTVGS